MSMVDAEFDCRPTANGLKSFSAGSTLKIRQVRKSELYRHYFSLKRN